ncbi:GAF domain-containing protein [Nonomuraea sp. NPDC050310]|uniref:helix-turn-helix domain-containing protein n=1 Tax=unclassified Nonomuraea TaxID=2593643 RepID=UPI0033DB8967
MTADLDEYSRRLRNAHESDAPYPGPRPEISESWGRSFQAGVSMQTAVAPLVYDSGTVGDVRRSHPLDPLLPTITGALRRMADETAHIMVITDAGGGILWRDGHAATMRMADRVGLADGHLWAEGSVGTNGIGTALVARKPVHVYSEEHLLPALHVWSCSGAPIVDPDTDQVLGCIDVSGLSRSLHPATVALVGTVARLAESQLALRMYERDRVLREAFRHRGGVLISSTGRVLAGDPDGRLGNRIAVPGPGGYTVLPDGALGLLEPFHDGFLLFRPPAAADPPPLRLTFLNDGAPTAQYGERTLLLSPRHAEILALLALHPHGLTGEQLSYYLYGDEGNPSTLRAEIHRLRAQFGGIVEAKPYRLNARVEADFLALKDLLATRRTTAAVTLYGGPLLPRSESPELRRERDELEIQLRGCLLAYGTPEDLWTYAQTLNGREDFEVLEQLTQDLPAHDPRALAARSRLTLD